MLLVDNVFQFDFIAMLWYLLNFVILFAALYVLLFKPIKKFIAKRNESIIEIQKENEELKEETAQSRVEYNSLIDEAKKELASANERAIQITKEKSEEILAKSKSEAQTIIEKAKEDAALDRLYLESDLKKEISSLSVEIAEKILKREISEKDNTSLVDEVLEKWNKDEN